MQRVLLLLRHIKEEDYVRLQLEDGELKVDVETVSYERIFMICESQRSKGITYYN